MKKLIVASLAAIQIFLSYGFLVADALADESDISNIKSAGDFIKIENNLITANFDRMPLSAVVKNIENQTGAHFTIKDPSILDYPLFIKIKEAKLEDALKRILKHYSYVTYFGSDGNVERVVIFEAKASALKTMDRRVADSASSQSSTPVSSSAFSDAGEESKTSNLTGKTSQTLSASQQNGGVERPDYQEEEPPEEPSLTSADIPYDLDEYQPLPVDLAGSDLSSSEPDPENPQGTRFTEEENLQREARLNQARLERSLSALNSEHAHLRSMAVEELVTVNDPRATTALANTASSKNKSPDERRQAAQALWNQAADFQFADETANGALVQLAGGDDPEVRDIARRALIDMERYQRKTAGNW